MEDLEQKLREFKESLFVAAPVIVQKITDYKDQRAKVKLKNTYKDKDTPEIFDVPISHNENQNFSERKLPEKGDVAWLVFMNRAIDKAIENSDHTNPEHDRVLSLNDCFLVGEWSPDDEGIPKSLGSMSKDDWLIGLNRGEKSRVYIRKNGNIVLEPGPDNKVELTEKPKYSVPLYELIMKQYLSHTHMTSMGPTSSPQSGYWTTEQGSNRVKVDH